ncbi:MAG: DUF3306 domain-containing protein [Burkholderiales bacterium]
MSADKEHFLVRWSRRKLKAEKAAPDPEAAVPAVAPAAASAAAPASPKPELPPVDSLQGLASEYKDFLNPQVDEKVRQAALKKLFHDPHFNVMDGLDTYIDDYSRPDPIPESMLRTLEHAKGLLFPEEKEETAKLAPVEQLAQADESGTKVPENTGRSEAGTPIPPEPQA